MTDGYVTQFRPSDVLQPVLQDSQGNMQVGTNVISTLVYAQANQTVGNTNAVVANGHRGTITMFGPITNGTGGAFAVQNTKVTPSSVILLNSASTTATGTSTRRSLEVALNALPTLGQFVVKFFNPDAAPTDTFNPRIYFTVI